MSDDIYSDIQQIAEKARNTCRALSAASTEQKNDALLKISRELESSRKILTEENEMDAAGIEAAVNDTELLELSIKEYTA